MNKILTSAALISCLAGSAMAATTISGAVPDSWTVTNYYKQNVYDSSDAKVGEISDVLMNKDGKVEAFIISVGGFLGIGNKDVAVPFSAVRATEKNGTWYLTMNATKDTLKQALGVRVQVRMLPPGTVPRTEVGKAVRVVTWAGGDPPLPGL